MRAPASTPGSVRKYKTWLPFLTECEWCGDDIRFFSPLSEDGKAKRPIRFCSRKCISEARWEGRKKVPSHEALSRLYVLKGLSIPKIAKMYSCSNSVVGKALKNYGVITTEHTSVRTCKIHGCRLPAHKTIHHRRSKDGARILYGTLCLKHRRKYFADWCRNKRHKMDPLIGTRKKGTKPIPTICPKCRTPHPSRRTAVMCCNQRWDKVKSMNAAA